MLRIKGQVHAEACACSFLIKKYMKLMKRFLCKNALKSNINSFDGVRAVGGERYQIAALQAFLMIGVFARL